MIPFLMMIRMKRVRMTAFNVKILLVIVPLAALVVWAVLSLIADKGESFAVDEISLPLTEEAAYMDDEIPST